MARRRCGARVARRVVEITARTRVTRCALIVRIALTLAAANNTSDTNKQTHTNQRINAATDRHTHGPTHEKNRTCNLTIACRCRANYTSLRPDSLKQQSECDADTHTHTRSAYTRKRCNCNSSERTNRTRSLGSLQRNTHSGSTREYASALSYAHAFTHQRGTCTCRCPSCRRCTCRSRCTRCSRPGTGWRSWGHKKWPCTTCTLRCSSFAGSTISRDCSVSSRSRRRFGRCTCTAKCRSCTRENSRQCWRTCM